MNVYVPLEQVSCITGHSPQLLTWIAMNALLIQVYRYLHTLLATATATVTTVIRDQLKIGTNIEVIGAYRLGKQRQADKPRPILVRFLRHTERMTVLKNVKMLAGTRQAITPDYPKEMQDRRSKLVPIMHQLRRQQVKNCSIREQGTDFVLNADGRPYITATDLEGDSEEARQLRQQYSVRDHTQRNNRNRIHRGGNRVQQEQQGAVGGVAIRASPSESSSSDSDADSSEDDDDASQMDPMA